MPTFTPMSAAEVQVGRARVSAEIRRQFVVHIRDAQAGRITLDRSDRPSSVKRLLAEASKQTGIKVRSSWADKKQMVLYWKRTGIGQAPHADRA